VVQLYLHDPVSRLRRPEQELVAFQKLALAPGETRTLHLTLDARALRFYDPEKLAWIAEPGEFERAGRSSRDLRARTRFTLRIRAAATLLQKRCTSLVFSPSTAGIQLGRSATAESTVSGG
jgi:beta-glucosidase